jgi:hypothetical protein
LRTLPHDKKIDPKDNGRFHVELSDEEAVRAAGQQIPRMVADLNLTLISFNRAVPNLEDVFVKLVGESEGRA